MIVVDRELIKNSNLNQREVVLLHLVKNGFITNKDCNECYGYRHLPSIIRDLKKLYGAKFDTITQKQVNRFAQKTDYVEYHLMNRGAFAKCL